MIDRFLVIVLLMVIAAGMTGCGPGKVTDEDVTVVTADSVAAAVGNDGVVLVDVRSPERFAAGHIPGAINIFTPDIVYNDSRLTGANRIILYAEGGSARLATGAAKRMLAMRYKGVEEFRGGLLAWQDSGRQVMTSSGTDSARPER